MESRNRVKDKVDKGERVFGPAAAAAAAAKEAPPTSSIVTGFMS